MKRELNALEIVAIGDELLSGATIDSNASLIAQKLEPIGLRVVRKTTVGDSESAIADVVRKALERTGAVITTGGLGPTADDVTRAAVAAVFDLPLEFREDLWAALLERWKLRGKIPDSNRVQAEVPRGGIVFPNARGTAPGIAIEDDDLGVCILLPGPPHELEAMVESSVRPFLAERAAGEAQRPFRRYLRTAGIAESAIAERVADRFDDLPIDVAFLPEIDCNDIRLTAWSADESAVAGALEEAVDRLRVILDPYIYAEGTVELAEVVGGLLKEKGLMAAVAESCTAGLIAKRLTDTAGSSEYFWGGVIAYADRAKVELLGVDAETLREHGAVSERTAKEMAAGVVRRTGAEVGIAVTGIAGPGGGTDEKPVGTVWLAVAVGAEVVVRRVHLPGTRDMVRERASQAALDLLRRVLEGTVDRGDGGTLDAQ
jgi:nicotinamide-nucleotide amidase